MKSFKNYILDMIDTDDRKKKIQELYNIALDPSSILYWVDLYFIFEEYENEIENIVAGDVGYTGYEETYMADCVLYATKKTALRLLGEMGVHTGKLRKSVFDTW